MTTIELYINNRLCDVGRDFGVRLNRQLINPDELNTKDAQYSYSIILPPTSNNHRIFNHANIEETVDKFNREYRAELIINGVRVFAGLFRLSEVARDKYKGNLYLPAVKSIKDIFGERKLNENPEYRIEFKDFSEYVSRYNQNAGVKPQSAIFPYVLYGLLRKVPRSSGDYSPRDTWDDSVKVGMQDFAPSINPLLMLKHIFKAQGYNLDGTAFNDTRLTNLYMSYKNESSYVQPWNYGRMGQIRLTGSWSNTVNRRSNRRQLEKGVFESNGAYFCDLFDCTNAQVNKVNDPGQNVLTRLVAGNDGEPWITTQIRIPTAGLYKIQLTANSKLEDNFETTEANGITYVAAKSGENGLEQIRSAIKLLRDRGRGDFKISSSRMDGVYHRDNLSQRPDSNPRLYPNFYGADKGTIAFIDLAQNENFVAGLQWGKRNNEDINLRDDSANYSQVNVAKPALSWDNSYKNNYTNRIAIHAPGGYWRCLLSEDGTKNWTHYPDYLSCTVLDSPANYALRGNFENANGSGDYLAKGSVNCIVWLEAGELLTLADATDNGGGWVAKTVTFDLTVTPFRIEPEWLKVGVSGQGTTVMHWNDPVSFDTDNIDLIKFLPGDIKTDDFIENFRKDFNLQLTQTGVTTFELNVKQSKASISNLFINLDNLASIHDRSNTPLGLPSLYKLGFTVDVEEEGYKMTGDDGGGMYETGITVEKKVEQKSNFSFNWFKNINKDSVVLPLPIISKHEVWTNELLYPDAMGKRYTNQALRFWYPDGLLNDLGATFNFNAKPMSIAKVSNELPGLNILNYKNQKQTILSNYFTPLISSGSHYTEVEGYLTPDQYEKLSSSIMAMFNGDLYYVAEISGYDPTGRNKSKIKLIRKI